MTRCPCCDDTGTVCENHPDKPWEGISNAPNACGCGAGMPCKLCCDPVPPGGSITDAFTPRRQRRGQL